MRRWTLGLAVLAGCAQDFSVDSTGAYNEYAGASDTTGGDGDFADTGGEEEEDDFLRMLPAATDAYVFVANAARGTVTRISVPSLAVVTAEWGRRRRWWRRRRTTRGR